MRDREVETTSSSHFRKDFQHLNLKGIPFWCNYLHRGVETVLPPTVGVVEGEPASYAPTPASPSPTITMTATEANSWTSLVPANLRRLQSGSHRTFRRTGPTERRRWAVNKIFFQIKIF